MYCLIRFTPDVAGADGLRLALRPALARITPEKTSSTEIRSATRRHVGRLSGSAGFSLRRLFRFPLGIEIPPSPGAANWRRQAGSLSNVLVAGDSEGWVV